MVTQKCELSMSTTSAMVTHPGTRRMLPRACSSTHASGPPRSLTVTGRGSRRLRRGRARKVRRERRSVLMASGGRAILTLRHSQVVDGNGCSLPRGAGSYSGGVTRSLAIPRRCLNQLMAMVDPPVARPASGGIHQGEGTSTQHHRRSSSDTEGPGPHSPSGSWSQARAVAPARSAERRDASHPAGADGPPGGRWRR